MRLHALLLGLSLCAPAVTAQPIYTGRPDFTEAADVVQQAQLELGGLGVRRADHRTYWFGEALLRMPVGAGLEAHVQGGLGRTEAGAVAEDVAVGAKVALRVRAPALAVQAGVGLAALTGAARIAGPTAEAKFSGSADVGPGMALTVHLGGALFREAAQEVAASVSLSAALSSRLGAFVEGSAVQAFPRACRTGAVADLCEPRLSPTAFVHAGGAFQPTATLQLDVRAGVGPGRTAFVGTGATVRL